MTLIYDYTTTENKTISAKNSFETNSTGIVVFPNTFINISYTIEARRYNHLFSTTTIGNLTASLWVNVTCPKRPLFILVSDSNERPLQNVQVKINEWGSERVMLTENTNETGIITSELTFGRYRITVSKHSDDFERVIVLNNTILDLIEEEGQFLVIYCKILGIAVSLQVVDYFGQPISNAVVEIERKGEQGWMKIDPSPRTDSGGIVLLPNIGGDYLISIYVTGSLDEARTITLTTPQQIVIKLDKYTLVGGYLIETSQFIAYISLTLLAVVVCLSLVYRKYVQTGAKKEITKEKISE